MMAADAIDEPRLARGLVREELRQVNDPYKNHAYGPLRTLMNSLANKHLPPSGKFSTPAAAKLMKLIVKEAAKHIHPFRTFDTAFKVEADDAKVSPVHGMFYWVKSKAQINVDVEEQRYQGDFVELRCMRVSGSRRRLMFDDASCHFFIGEHCLARMLERGAAPRDALKDLTAQFDNVVPTAMMFAATFTSGRHHSRYPQVIIPYKSGILLCKVILMNLKDKDFAGWHRFRITADKGWTKASEFSEDPLLIRKQKDRTGAISIYAATYVPKMQMSTEQIWAKMQIEQVMEEERPHFDSYLKLVSLLENLDAELPKRLPDLYCKLDKVMKNPRWTIATSATLLQGG